MIAKANFTLTDFDLTGRTVLDNEQTLPWVEETVTIMVGSGEIGPELFQGLVAEYHRRATDNCLYGYQAFATAIGQKS